MANSVSPVVSRVVNKLPLGLSEKEAVLGFWDRCAPGVKDSLDDALVERYEKEVRTAYRERQKREARNLDMVA